MARSFLWPVGVMVSFIVCGVSRVKTQTAADILDDCKLICKIETLKLTVFRSSYAACASLYRRL